MVLATAVVFLSPLLKQADEGVTNLTVHREKALPTAWHQNREGGTRGIQISDVQ